MSDLSHKTIITVATTGAWPGKNDNPNIPLTPQEIAEDVYLCWKAGAAVAHIHVRDELGCGTMNTDKFTETVNLIRKKCDIVINLTTSGDLKASEEDRMAHLIKLKPELASYDAGTMNWMHNSLFINHPHFLEKLGNTMIENNVKPEVEIFDAGMIYNSLHYLKKGILKAPLHYQFCLGVAGGMAATIENLVFLKGLLPENSTWSAFGVGKNSLPITFAAIALGGHVRVGMEDNVYYKRDKLAASNVEFIERTVRLINEADREAATPAEAREILGV